ncbi:MAG TPA: outer membrane beta-barrel protein [Puia sp.]|nr:outer membrane beta-barrel protein [Puia sp.]
MRPLKIFMLITAMGTCFYSSAQQKDSSVQHKGPSFIGITGGISLPTGNWAKSNYVVSTTGYVDDPAGYASSGPIIGLEGAYFFSKNIGVGGIFSYATYKVKDLDMLSGGYRESFDVDQVTTTATSYQSWSLMPGLYFDFPLTHRLSATARALAGITNSSTPRISVDVEDGGIDDGTFEQKSASKTAFGFEAGIGLNYRITKCFGIILHGDYFYSKPDFTIENTQRNNAAGRYVTEYNQPLAGINVSLGVAYLFCKK